MLGFFQRVDELLREAEDLFLVLFNQNLDVVHDVFEFFLHVFLSVEHARVFDVLEHTSQSVKALDDRTMELVYQHLMQVLIVQQVLDFDPPYSTVNDLSNSTNVVLTGESDHPAVFRVLKLVGAYLATNFFGFLLAGLMLVKLRKRI